MSQRPIIGVTTQTLQSIDGIPAGLPQSQGMVIFKLAGSYS